MNVSESRWEGSGGRYALAWGGRTWTLDLEETDPGLRSETGNWCSNLLSLFGLAAHGRFETRVFTPATLVGVERHRSRVQATFAPPDWGGLIVRAAWSPVAGTGVDMEVQASATSVGELRAVEIVIQSQWRRTDIADRLAGMSRSILARDTHSASLSYDGRESPENLRLTTVRPIALTTPYVFMPPDSDSGSYYVEMVQPNDVARRIRLEPSDPERQHHERLVLQYALFGHDFEKGVVFRARLRAFWLAAQELGPDAGPLYEQFLNEPLPLGP
jgi:hypothetical protein